MYARILLRSKPYYQKDSGGEMIEVKENKLTGREVHILHSVGQAYVRICNSSSKDIEEAMIIMRRVLVRYGKITGGAA